MTLPDPNMLQSWRIWSDQGINIKSWNLFDDTGVCAVCRGADQIKVGTSTIACGCWLSKWVAAKKESIEPYQNQRLRGKTLDNLVAVDQSMADAIMFARQFVAGFGSSWLVIRGVAGCGKTHIASAIADALAPVSLFISLLEFDSLVYGCLNNGRGDLSEATEAIERAPVLILDDLAAGWGSPFVVAKLREIIDFRYRSWDRYPTIITTNLIPKTERQQFDERIISRINDAAISKQLIITSPDFRIAPVSLPKPKKTGGYR